jgi:hypothetical protein
MAKDGLAETRRGRACAARRHHYRAGGAARRPG